jgi:hypothetical protein
VTRTATRPATPAAKRLAASAGRYSLVRAERDTEPPSAPDAAEVDRFEREINEHGEPQARLLNLQRRTR